MIEYADVKNCDCCECECTAPCDCDGDCPCLCHPIRDERFENCYPCCACNACAEDDVNYYKPFRDYPCDERREACECELGCHCSDEYDDDDDDDEEECGEDCEICAAYAARDADTLTYSQSVQSGFSTFEESVKAEASAEQTRHHVPLKANQDEGYDYSSDWD